MNIAIGNSIGYSNNANKVAGLFQYLINDTFTTDRVAGAINGTAAEPGPGLRTVVDTENKLSLTGESASFTPRTTPANGDPGLWYGAFSRNAGNLVLATVVPTQTNKAFDIGLDNNQSGTPFGVSFLFRGTGVITERISGNARAALYTYSAISYNVAIAVRSTGAYMFLYLSGNWILLWPCDSGNTNPYYVAWTNFDATATLPMIKFPTGKWLPTPLASDGFSTWGTTDGLGHTEGSEGGLGVGGSSLTWTQNVGTWVASSGTANASALSGGLAIATVDTGKTDVIATVAFTRNGGNGGIVVRFADTNNFVRGQHTGTNAQLVQRIAGVETTLIDAASTYVAGAELRVICEGTAFRLYYNNSLIGSQQTIVGLSGTKQGLRTTDITNTFDNFTVYARGSGGEYATLDGY